MSFIKCENVQFFYDNKDEDSNLQSENKLTIDNVNFEVDEGEIISILGRNGSGKSTFAKLLNSILIPKGGTIIVDGIDSSDAENIWNIRKNVGMVFQNPDNQIVATIVEEDVAFGVENLGIESSEIRKRVDYALSAVDMADYAKKAPHLLSGGQKQRIAIAGILAMHPKCIIFDESTSMLDPVGRKNVIDIILELNKKEKITIIIITHFMEEALLSDKVFVMENGKVVLNGTPKQIFSNADKIKKFGLDLPIGADISERLRNLGFDISRDVVYKDEFVEYIAKKGLKNIPYQKVKKVSDFKEKIVDVQNLSYVYGEKSVFENVALKNVNFEIYKGEISAIIGKTGSGKSTLVQTLNGLIKPTDGKVLVFGKDINQKDDEAKAIRRKIGIVFQYPEYQLFEETVFKDAMFGPLNMGFSNEEAEQKVTRAFEIVGVGQELFEKSPFELSGGQKRRVAIAGVIAMQPEVLILDEPTAGLDPVGRDDLIKTIKNMRDKFGMTVVIVSHSMEEVSKVADKVIVMNDGQVQICGDCDFVFSSVNENKQSGIMPPIVNTLFKEINDRGVSVPQDIYTIDEAVYFLKERL